MSGASKNRFRQNPPPGPTHKCLKIATAGPCYQAQASFAVERDSGDRAVLMPNPNDKLRLTIVASRDFRTDDNRFEGFRHGSQLTLAVLGWFDKNHVAAKQKAAWPAHGKDVQVPALDPLHRAVERLPWQSSYGDLLNGLVDGRGHGPTL